MSCDNCIHYELCQEWSYRSLLKMPFCRNNEHFKAKSVNTDENYYTHICKAEGLINEFSIFARVVDETDDTITIERFQMFGALKIRNITISKQDFERYYKKI